MSIKSVNNNNINQIRRGLNKNTDLAILGQTSDPNSAVFVNGRPGYWWVRPIQAGGTFGPPKQVRGCLVPMQTTPGTPVRLGVVEGENAVTGLDFIGIVAQGGNPTQSAATDPNTNNPSFVNQAFIATAYEQIVEGTLKVGLRGAIPLSAGVFVKVEGQFNFTGNVPSAGSHRLAVTAIQSDLATLETQYSTAKNTLIPLDIDDLNEAWALMSAPTTNKPLWAWSLADGQTTLVEVNRWADIRQFLNWETNTATGDVVGPSSAINNDLAAFDGTTGKLIKDSGILASAIALVANLKYQILKVGGSAQTARGKLNLIAGTNITITPVDNSGADSTDVTIASSYVDTGITQLTGDVTAGPGSGSQVATLATVNSNVGTFSRVKSVTANAKGLITAITQGLVDLASEVTGLLPLANGGSGANLSATGPGPLFQASSGANVTVPSALTQVYVADIERPPCRALSTTNISISSPGLLTIDGVSIVANDRIFLYNQTTGSEDGPWVWNGAAVPMTRPADFPSGNTVLAFFGVRFFIRLGTTNGGSEVMCLTTGTITIDTTAVNWTIQNANVNTVNGTLPVANGGTGDATLTAHALLKGNGTSAVQFISPSANHNVLVDNGTDFVSQALTNSELPLVGLAKGGSNADLSATGPGVLTQASSGAAVTLTNNYLRHLFVPEFADVNSSANTENDVFTHTLAAGQLATNGDIVNFRTTLFQNSASGTKTIRLYFGGNNYQTLSVSATLGVGAVITAEVTIIRVSSSSVRIRGFMQATASATASTTYTPFLADVGSLTLSNTQVVKVTSQSSVNNSNNVVGKTCEVEYMAAA